MRLQAHLMKYLEELATKGRDERYIYHVCKRNERLFRECGWSLPRDVTAASFTDWRQRNRAKAPKTLNEYLDAASSFFSWLVRFGHVEKNPLTPVGKVQTLGRETRVRGSFTVDELQRLLAVAGPRRLVYLTAVFTGLRREELASLLVSDIHLGAEVPFVFVRASTTKNHRSARLALHPDLLAELRQAIPDGTLGARPLFAEIPSVAELRRDEEAAGIPFMDEKGRRDFHSFRHTFTTWLAQSGLLPQIAKHLTRHSDGRMNEHYTDYTKLPLAEAIRSLPSVTKDAHRDAQARGAEGLQLSTGVAEEVNGRGEQTPVVFGESRGPSRTDANGQGTEMAPEVGLEPTTTRLTAACSTIELLWNSATGAQRSGAFSEPSKGFLFFSVLRLHAIAARSGCVARHRTLSWSP